MVNISNMTKTLKNLYCKFPVNKIVCQKTFYVLYFFQSIYSPDFDVVIIFPV